MRDREWRNDERERHDRHQMISIFALICIGLVFHVVYMLSIFDIYFKYVKQKKITDGSAFQQQCSAQVASRQRSSECQIDNEASRQAARIVRWYAS